MAHDEDGGRMNRYALYGPAISDPLIEPQRTREKGGETDKQEAGYVLSIYVPACPKQPEPVREGAERERMFGHGRACFPSHTASLKWTQTTPSGQQEVQNGLFYHFSEALEVKGLFVN
jgi:hypothetical protein